MSLGRTFKLNSGYTIPAVGLGTWLSKPNEVEKAVEIALKTGYRHIDGAAIYRNEQEVGRGIKASGVPRSEIFLTSKLWNNSQRPEEVPKAIAKTLKDLQVDYLDLYLIHWPLSFVPGKDLIPIDPETGLAEVEERVPISETWAALEKLVEQGLVRSIGVSNFNIKNLEEVLAIAKIKPAVNQIELHPYLQQNELLEFQKKHDIHATAYSPLGHNVYGELKTIDDPVIQETAKSLGKDPAQLIISWAVQRGTSAVPKSVTASRIVSNFQDFIIPDEEFAKINALDRHLRFNDPVEWGVDIFGEQGGDAAALEKAKKIAASKK